MNRSARHLRTLLGVILAAVTAACANMGRPEGGPRDETPPVYVRSNPSMGQLNVDATHITVDFDENISLQDAMTKIVVSPAQKTPPAISSNGRRVSLELRDTLLPNTTYTIDFADAVKDLNEGNILDGFAMDFSTGPEIDTLRISGMVFEARTLEPAQGMLVGAYSNLSDTAITTLPFERIAKTNQLGQFTLRGLKPGSYRIFAINDVNRDYHWDRSEDIAFYDALISPSSERVTVTDTVVSASGLRDSVVTRPATRFIPDDVLLTWFNEGYSNQYLKDYKRDNRNRIDIQMGTKADSLPILRLLNTHRAGQTDSEWAVLNSSHTLDTLQYWIKDTALISIDTLLIETRYQRTDTNNLLSWTTDTLRFAPKNLRAERKRKEQEAKQREKELEKRREKGDTLPLTDSVPPPPPLDIKINPNGTVDLNKQLSVTASTPFARFDPAALRLEMKVDTLWYPVASPTLFLPDSLRPMALQATPIEWLEDTKYRLTVDSAAFEDIYGLVNKPLVQEFTTKQRSDYSSIAFNISGIPSGQPAVLEVLTSDTPVTSIPFSGSYVKAEYLNPGTYYARMFIDTNGDGRWTTGSVADSIQPEEVFYFPKKLNLKKNWDVEQSWNIYEVPVDLQKPAEIKKNKPKLKKGEKPEGTTEEEEEDEWATDPFMRSHGTSSSSGFGNGRFNSSNTSPNLR